MSSGQADALTNAALPLLAAGTFMVHFGKSGCCARSASTRILVDPLRLSYAMDATTKCPALFHAPSWSGDSRRVRITRPPNSLFTKRPPLHEMAFAFNPFRPRRPREISHPQRSPLLDRPGQEGWLRDQERSREAP